MRGERLKINGGQKEIEGKDRLGGGRVRKGRYGDLIRDENRPQEKQNIWNPPMAAERIPCLSKDPRSASDKGRLAHARSSEAYLQSKNWWDSKGEG